MWQVKRSGPANPPARSDKRAATSEVMKTVQKAHINYILHYLHLIDFEVNSLSKVYRMSHSAVTVSLEALRNGKVLG
jgi:hypothetical protein